MSTPSLPSYTHADIPLYSRHPVGNEQTLGLTRRARRPGDVSRLRDWTKKSGNVTLTLTDLPGDVELPVYGRNTAIEGYIFFESTDGITSVRVKLEGHLKCQTIAEIGRTKTQILDTVVPLWYKDGSDLPVVLPFRIPFPSVFTLEDETAPLPPSFEYTSYDVQGGTAGLRAAVKYTLQVEIEPLHTSLKDRFSSFLSTTIIYYPRSRPGQAISSVPATPFEAIMEHRVGKSRELDPIIWKLILPQPGTYCLKQPIPFRVTVTSRSISLIAPFAPRKKDNASIRVYILRQVAIIVQRSNLWRSFIIGEGTLNYMAEYDDGGLWRKTASPSPMKSAFENDSTASLSEREDWASHNWTGVLNVDQSRVSLGGFKAGNLAVKDFIVLAVIPPNPNLGTLLEAKRIVPIQLTTDNVEGTHQIPIAIPFGNQADATPGADGYLGGRDDGHHNGDYSNGTSRNGLSRENNA